MAEVWETDHLALQVVPELLVGKLGRAHQFGCVESFWDT